MLIRNESADPYAAYIKAGYPIGPWQVEIISPSKNNYFGNTNNSLAIHIHVHYADVLDEIYERIKFNSTKADLYITYSDKNIFHDIQSILDKMR